MIISWNRVVVFLQVIRNQFFIDLQSINICFFWWILRPRKQQFIVFSMETGLTSRIIPRPHIFLNLHHNFVVLFGLKMHQSIFDLHWLLIILLQILFIQWRCHRPHPWFNSIILSLLLNGSLSVRWSMQSSELMLFGQRLMNTKTWFHLFYFLQDAVVSLSYL